MAQWFAEWREGLFEVRQSTFTGRKIFFSFCLLMLIGMSLPMYFMYEDRVQEKYAHEFTMVREAAGEYREATGGYPVGDPINWEREKNLAEFFRESHLETTRQLYYLDPDQLTDPGRVRYTYIIDVNTGLMFTSEYVIYRMRRMHIPGI